jgi:hypothetical protein
MQIQLREKTMSLGNFGIEIEMYNVDSSIVAYQLTSAGIPCNVEGYNHTTRGHWKIVGDGSISGQGACELVSPVLNGADGLAQIDRVCMVLEANNAKVNRSCGLHVHHDANGFTADSLKKVIKTYARIEKMVDGFMPVSRRGSRSYYAKSVIGIDYDRHIEDGGTEGGSRYYKVNCQSFYRHGTVEFRQHSGTVDADKIKNWVLFTALVVEKARGRVASDKVLDRWVDVKWFLNITTDRCDQIIKDMVEFYTARRAHFARA